MDLTTLILRLLGLVGVIIILHLLAVALGNYLNKIEAAQKKKLEDLRVTNELLDWYQDLLKTELRESLQQEPFPDNVLVIGLTGDIVALESLANNLRETYEESLVEVSPIKIHMLDTMLVGSNIIDNVSKDDLNSDDQQVKELLLQTYDEPIDKQDSSSFYDVRSFLISMAAGATENYITKNVEKASGDVKEGVSSVLIFCGVNLDTEFELIKKYPHHKILRAITKGSDIRDEIREYEHADIGAIVRVISDYSGRKDSKGEFNNVYDTKDPDSTTDEGIESDVA